jgi:hypothetical protein
LRNSHPLSVPPDDNEDISLDDRLPLNYFQTHYLEMEVRPAVTLDDLDDENHSFEFVISLPYTNAVPDCPPIGPHEMLVYKTSKQSGTRRMVTQRDDLLTPEEVRARWREVEMP